MTVGQALKLKQRVQPTVIAPSPAPNNIDMNLPHPAPGTSKKRKHSAAENVDEGVGLDGTDPGDPDGPQRAPAYRVRLQGQGLDDAQKYYPGRNPNPATADEPQRNRKSTVYAEAKSTLRGVKESPNAYPPLRSIAEDLCCILDNCEVWSLSRKFNSHYLPSF